ncbi:MAG: hypothetical protein JWO37_2110 [Acidimicrobiales bacterium]|nr:hypothetical protein [Acidimicrobiales bacterium]
MTELRCREAVERGAEERAPRLAQSVSNLDTQFADPEQGGPTVLGVGLALDESGLLQPSDMAAQRGLVEIGELGEVGQPERPTLRSPATTLVEILLYDGCADDAWDAAVAHGCDDHTWLSLARAREAGHPLDVIPIYQRAAASLIDEKNNRGYRAAVDLLARIGALAQSAGEPALFEDVLVSVRSEHGRKRNLMALIDERHW